VPQREPPAQASCSARQRAEVFERNVSRLRAIVLAASQPGATARRARARRVFLTRSGRLRALRFLAARRSLHMYREYGNPGVSAVQCLVPLAGFPSYHDLCETLRAEEPRGCARVPAASRLAGEHDLRRRSARPDLRFLALVVLAVAIAAAAFWPRASQGSSRSLRSLDARLLRFSSGSPTLHGWAHRPTAATGMLVLLLVGPLVARLADRLFPWSRRAARCSYSWCARYWPARSSRRRAGS
jgi:hypothetical protein